jgi:hypothetical protein
MYSILTFYSSKMVTHSVWSSEECINREKKLYRKTSKLGAKQRISEFTRVPTSGKPPPLKYCTLSVFKFLSPLTFCAMFDHSSYFKKLSYILLWFDLSLKKFEIWLIILYKKGQPGALSSQFCQERASVWPLWVLCTQHFPTFLQEAVSRTWTHELMVTRKQFYHCARAPLHDFNFVYGN